MIFDTHTHYDAEQFDNDRVELLSSMREHNVGFILNVGATLDGCKSSVEFARKYPFMYAAVGVHPDEVGALNDETFAWMEELLLDEKAVAVGRLGLTITGIMSQERCKRNGLSVSLRLRESMTFRSVSIAGMQQRTP